MGLIVYECEQPNHGHERRQWKFILPSLYDYFEGRNELALLIINFSVGNVELDGLLIKNGAIIIIELKDRSGIVTARMNGHWTCTDDKNNPIIHGGSGGKNVYKQAFLNRITVKNTFKENGYFTEAQVNDLQVLVVFTQLDEVTDDFDRSVKSWLHLTSINTIDQTIHSIISKDFYLKSEDKKVSVEILDKDLFSFIEKKLDERNLVTQYSDVHLLPSHLFDVSRPHNGKLFNTATELKNTQEELKEVRQVLYEQQNINKELELFLRNQESARQNEINTLKKQMLVMQKRSEQENIDDNKKELWVTIKSLVTDIEELQEQLTVLKEDRSQLQTEKTSESVIGKPTKDFDISEDSMDDDQLDLIEKTLDKSMLVTGPAGCGKSVIALHKAKQIAESGMNVIFISFTKTLNDYVGTGYESFSSFPCYYHYEWCKKGRPEADYLVVDEVQDFTENDIRDFMAATRKSFFFFGDSAQSIFSFEKKQRMSMEELSNLTGLPILYLYNNYRLPKTVAKITQDYVGVQVQPYSDKIYKSNEKILPFIVQYSDTESELEGIVKILKKHNHVGIGILAFTNEEVYDLYRKLSERGISCEYKCQFELNDMRNNNSISFCNISTKILTLYSAKGLQFETVIIPNYSGAATDSDKRKLYVAMTRTYKNLYVLYHTDQLLLPLSNVPTHLYLKEI